MPIEIKVGPPLITISQGRTFMVSDVRGEIDPRTSQGVYGNDTRFVSRYSLQINGLPLDLINSSQLTFFASRFHLTNPLIHLDGGKLLKAQTLHLTLNRSVDNGIHEDIDIVNYSGSRVHFLLELDLISDFADIFEVRTQKTVQRGKIITHWDVEEKCLHTSYDHQDFHRALAYAIQDDVAVSYANGHICFEITLEPNQHWHTCAEMILEHDLNAPPHERMCCHNKHPTPASITDVRADFNQKQLNWRSNCTHITTSNYPLYRMYQQALEDMQALRIYDMDISSDIWVPAAGVPWFVTLFGRDSLIASYQSMVVSSGFALGALQRLAQYQAAERDDWRDAQPGKILHELRYGELAYFRMIPFTPYYGTADATMLFLIVLSETYRWLGDRKLLETYRETARQCLQWIDQYGDLDADGFQEYKTFSDHGYENLGWKDAEDAVVYADGTQVKQPKALCELQAYVYDAKIRLAEIFFALDEANFANDLLQQAAKLKQQFNQAFWVEDEGCFAFGLDAEKNQITSIASNAGQCLWSGIAEPEKAKRTAQRLLQEDMWSGWGIRTLSSKNPAYNPFAYHLGAVWPHDNGIIAEGFKRYNLSDEANQIARGIFDAIEHFEHSRPPELFAGIQRKGELDFPVLYPDGANIPQAWATGSIFQLLHTMLGLRADAPHKRLYLKPTLPVWLPDITIHNLHIGRCTLSIRFWREGENSAWEVIDRQAETEEEAIEVLNDPGRSL